MRDQEPLKLPLEHEQSKQLPHALQKFLLLTLPTKVKGGYGRLTTVSQNGVNEVHGCLWSQQGWINQGCPWAWNITMKIQINTWSSTPNIAKCQSLQARFNSSKWMQMEVLVRPTPWLSKQDAGFILHCAGQIPTLLLSNELAPGIEMFPVAELAPAQIETWRKNVLPKTNLNRDVNGNTNYNWHQLNQSGPSLPIPDLGPFMHVPWTARMQGARHRNGCPRLPLVEMSSGQSCESSLWAKCWNSQEIIRLSVCLSVYMYVQVCACKII